MQLQVLRNGLFDLTQIALEYLYDALTRRNSPGILSVASRTKVITPDLIRPEFYLQSICLILNKYFVHLHTKFSFSGNLAYFRLHLFTNSEQKTIKSTVFKHVFN